MYVALNPAKRNKFTTKGINLTLSKPIAFVDPGLESEFMDIVRTALFAEELVEISDETMKNFQIKNQAQLERDEDSDIKTVGIAETIKSDPDEYGRRRVESYVLKFAEDPNLPPSEHKYSGPSLILTQIESEHDTR
jgi:hypothetical protein